MKEIIKLQGGDPNVKIEDIEIEKFRYNIIANKNGIIGSLNNYEIAKMARLAGAPKNKGAGIYLHKHIGDKVKKGEPIMTLYAGSKDKVDYVKNIFKDTDNLVSIKA
jgi:AMP phosphorylase